MHTPRSLLCTDLLALAKSWFLWDPTRLLPLPEITAVPPSFSMLCKQRKPRFDFNKSDAEICFIIPMKTEGTKRGGELQGNSDLQIVALECRGKAGGGSPSSTWPM